MSVLLRRSLQPLRLSPLFAALPQHLRAGMCASSSDEIQKKLSELVAAKDVVVFMKGVPEAPMCGFSNAVVQILKMHGVENFDAHNVLEDNEIREGVKKFSNWPTIPQIYFKGEFIGGCDLMIQMHQSGEIVQELQKLGITSRLADQYKKSEDESKNT